MHRFTFFVSAAWIKYSRTFSRSLSRTHTYTALSFLMPVMSCPMANTGPTSELEVKPAGAQNEATNNRGLTRGQVMRPLSQYCPTSKSTPKLAKTSCAPVLAMFTVLVKPKLLQVHKHNWPVADAAQAVFNDSDQTFVIVSCRSRGQSRPCLAHMPSFLPVNVELLLVQCQSATLDDGISPPWYPPRRGRREEATGLPSASVGAKRCRRDLRRAASD